MVIIPQWASGACLPRPRLLVAALFIVGLLLRLVDRKNGTIAEALEGRYASGRWLLVATGRAAAASPMGRFNPAVQFEGADRFIPVL